MTGGLLVCTGVPAAAQDGMAGREGLGAHAHGSRAQLLLLPGDAAGGVPSLFNKHKESCSLSPKIPYDSQRRLE